MMKASPRSRFPIQSSRFTRHVATGLSPHRTASLADRSSTRVHGPERNCHDRTRRLPPAIAEQWSWQIEASCRGMDVGVFYHPAAERTPLGSTASGPHGKPPACAGDFAGDLLNRTQRPPPIDPVVSSLAAGVGATVPT